MSRPLKSSLLCLLFAFMPVMLLTEMAAAQEDPEAYLAPEEIAPQAVPAPEVAASYDPNFPINIWENEFRQTAATNPIAQENAYRDLLIKIRDFLINRGIASQINYDYRYSSFGEAYLAILAIPKGPNTLNQVAQDISKENFEFVYWPKNLLLKTVDEGPIILVKSAAKQWLFNGNTLQNLDYLFANNVFRQNLEIIQRQRLDPPVAEAIYDYLFSYKNARNFTVDLAHPLPYFTLMINAARKIYVPHLSHRTSYHVAKSLAFNNYRTLHKLGDFAEKVLHKINVGDPSSIKDFYTLRSFYFSFLNDMSLHIINLNAVLYIMIERPWDVYFKENKLHPGKMMAFVNVGQSRNNLAYILNIPWKQKILINGNTSPLLLTPEFQIFYRYHLDLFYGLQNITHLAAAGKVDDKLSLKPFLRSLIDLANRSPNEVGKAVQKKLWDLNQLRYYLGETQELAVTNTANNKLRHERFNQSRSRRTPDCAKNVLPPPPPRASAQQAAAK